VLQSSSLYPNLTVAESLRVFGGYYAHPRDAEEVTAIVGLGEKRDARVRTLSGGQKRRLDLGLALIGDPTLIFLDEPTTGFDPGARRAAWETIRNLRELGKTILLTTHYLDEAEQLADRVAVLATA
jgi:ABC-type multidrug transport system, ATPase component